MENNPRGTKATFRFSIGKFLLATALDALSAVPFENKNSKPIPKIKIRKFLRAQRGPERWQFLQKNYVEKGPLVQIPVLPGWFKPSLTKLAAAPRVLGGGYFKSIAQHFSGYPTRMVFITDSEMLSELAKQTDSLERVYQMLGFQVTVGADSIFLINDGGGEKTWRETHDLLIPFFTREKSIKLYSQMIREEAVSAADRFRGADGILSVRQLADYTSASVIHRLLFGLSIAPADFAQLNELAEGVWQGQPARGKTHTPYRCAFENIVASLEAKISSDCIMAALKTKASDHGPDWLMNQLATLFFAGQETTRVLLAFALYELVSHPRYQPAFLNPTVENETERGHFLKEVLRQNPPVAWIPRLAIRDVKIGEYLIPAGSSIQIDLKALHSSGVNWGDDNGEFQPERFSKPLAIPLSYCPFGFGKRVCIGQHIATLEAQTVLSEWLKFYEITLVDANRPRMDFSRSGVPSMEDGFRMRFSARKTVRSQTAPNPIS